MVAEVRVLIPSIRSKSQIPEVPCLGSGSAPSLNPFYQV